MAFARILKAELDMVETCFYKLRQALAGKTDSRSDQVAVQARLARPRDHFGQVHARQGLASGEMKMQHPERGGLVEDAQPVGGRKLFLPRGQLQRVRAVHAMQRAAVRDL